MSETRSNNKRIAKNTIFLYIRMLLVMVVSLYTVRVVLNSLGAEDYGIHNVVGGLVSMFSFLTGTMVSASLRFFAFELGRKDYGKLNQYFNITFWCYLIIAAIVLIVAETVGLWFLHTKMVIPANRMTAALWVYHFSIMSFIIQMVIIPYNSLILAHEEMTVYAYIGIIEVILKLLVAYLLVFLSVDKLKLYAVLLFSVSFFTMTFYIIYSRKKYKESRLTLFWNKSMFKEIYTYCGWNLFGALSSVFRSQGINILINMFFNPVVNAARAIAYQVNVAVSMFVNNFYTAVRPQITKQFAANEQNEMMKLVFRSSRFCYYLILILAIPILIEAPFILRLWLHDFPNYTVIFTRLVIITSMIESISSPLMTAVQATGKIKWYQTVTGGLLLLNLPISYVFLKFGYPPQITMLVSIGLAIVSHISRLVFMRHLFHMSIREYMREILCVISFVTIVVLLPSYGIFRLMDDNFIRLVMVILVDVIFCLVAVYSIGINKTERYYLNETIRKKLRRK